jgi:molybdate transport system ATP-binding protein
MDNAALKLCFNVPLDRFTLDIDCECTHRVTGLFGPSGSGKTTLIESIIGLRKRARGYIACGASVWMDSEQLIFVKTEHRGIGYVPQDHLLFPHYNVRKNLECGVARSQSKGADFAAIFKEVVEVLELDSLLNRKTADLSGGEKQRVALGRALCSCPRVLMLDEPLASLDLELRDRILPFLIRVKDHLKIPILMVSHNPMELQALCDEVMVLREGKIIAQGSPQDVFTREDIYLK